MFQIILWWQRIKYHCFCNIILEILCLFQFHQRNLMKITFAKRLLVVFETAGLCWSVLNTYWSNKDNVTTPVALFNFFSPSLFYCIWFNTELDIMNFKNKVLFCVWWNNIIHDFILLSWQFRIKLMSNWDRL